jgi:hypothetical protein
MVENSPCIGHHPEQDDNTTTRQDIRVYQQRHDQEEQ